MRAGGDLGADFGQVRIHRLGADAGQDERGPDAAIRAHGAEQVGRTVALVAWRARPAALVGPDISQGALLPDPGLVLPPDFERLAAGVLRHGGTDQFGEVFLCASSASTS